MASDRYGRRPIIVFGLLLFIIGGVVCALAPSINWIILGRVIQGLGAVSAAITAWVADATRPELRTRAMARVGEIGRAQFGTPVTNAQLVYRLLLEKKQKY